MLNRGVVNVGLLVWGVLSVYVGLHSIMLSSGVMLYMCGLERVRRVSLLCSCVGVMLMNVVWIQRPDLVLHSGGHRCLLKHNMLICRHPRNKTVHMLWVDVGGGPGLVHAGLLLGGHHMVLGGHLLLYKVQLLRVHWGMLHLNVGREVGRSLLVGPVLLKVVWTSTACIGTGSSVHK